MNVPETILAECRCGQKYKLPAKLAGGRLPCKHCDSFFRVPLIRPTEEVEVKLFCGHTAIVRDCDIKPTITCPTCHREMKVNVRNNVHLCDRIICYKTEYGSEGQKGAKPVPSFSAVDKALKKKKKKK